MNKRGSMGLILLVMLASLAIAFFWDSLPFIKNSVNAVLNPTAGAILNWDLTLGMVIIVLMISIFMTVIQKYATEQKALREIKGEQKKIQEEMKKFQAGSKEHT